MADPPRIASRPAPFEHLFVATDFSAGAAQAVARAARLPIAERGKITLVHVLPEQLPQKARADAEKNARQKLDQARDALTESAAAQGRASLEVASELCKGHAYVEIIRHARAIAADLIVLGRHGARPLHDMFIGSTPERVIRAGDLPVLVVNRRATRPYCRPLVATDLEDTCRSVVTLALRVLGPEVTSARMVHAYHVPFEGFITPGASPGLMTDLRKEYRDAARSGFARLEESLRELGVRWQTTIVCEDPRAAILAEVVRRRVDLLALGTHGRSGIAHTLLGSVAEWVVRAAACDVLVARPARVSFQLP